MLVLLLAAVLCLSGYAGRPEPPTSATEDTPQAAESEKSTKMTTEEKDTKEYEIFGLMKERLSNREIAKRLFLSEGSIKQYINQIYSKLNIDGGYPGEAAADFIHAECHPLTFG